MIRAIVALDDTRGIAAQGVIPWDIPRDRQYFRRMTIDSTILMGRETYEQFSVPLASRRNVVASKTLQSVRGGFELTHDAAAFVKQNNNLWVIGGAQLYESLITMCDELYITHVAGDYSCDRFFPDFEGDFTQVESSPRIQQNGYHYTFAMYKKNR